MCYACSHDPLDLLEDAVEVKKLRGQFTEQQLNRFRAALIKQSLRLIHDETGGQHCDAGTKIVDELRERQYRISREI